MDKIGLIDLDDTLADLKNPMMEALNKNTSKNIHWSEWDTFNLPKKYNISDELFLDICINEKVIEKAKINPSSKHFLNNLKKLGYYNVLITARGWNPIGELITQKWLNDNNLDIDELILVEMDQSKTDKIKKFGLISFSIDDRIKHCREYIQSNLIDNVILFDAPWNSHMTRWNPFWRGYDYHYRVGDLNEIISLLEPSEELIGENGHVC